jgi:6-phosphogluconolactonase
VEVIVAPIAELRKRITTRFEEVVRGVPTDGDNATAEPYGFSCGITGGSTALIFLGALRDAGVPWRRIMLYWGDERAVPPDHPDSNYLLAERLLISPLAARAPHAERMEGESSDLHAAARAYDARLPTALDLIILGVGDDGHVCSLFPGHQALQVKDARVLVIEDSPKPPSKRLTLSLPYVCQSRRVWVVAVGEAKQPVLQAAVSGVGPNTPLDLVVQRARDVTVFTDFDERCPFQIQQTGRRRLVAPGPREGPLNQIAFDLFHQIGKVDAGIGKIQRRRHRELRELNLGRQITDVNRRSSPKQRQRTLDGILELTHVARP